MKNKDVKAIKLVNGEIDYKGTMIKEPTSTEYGEWVGIELSHEERALVDAYYSERHTISFRQAIEKLVSTELERAEAYFDFKHVKDVKLNSLQQKQAEREVVLNG